MYDGSSSVAERHNTAARRGRSNAAFIAVGLCFAFTFIYVTNEEGLPSRERDTIVFRDRDRSVMSYDIEAVFKSAEYNTPNVILVVINSSHAKHAWSLRVFCPFSRCCHVVQVTIQSRS